MAHDFKAFPELTNSQMQLYYFDSPHKQITGDFTAQVVRVIDGDTIRVKASFRDFDFPVRLANIAAAELNESGGLKSKSWLENKISNATVEIIVDPQNRVGKFGRLIGEIIAGGLNINEASMRENSSEAFGARGFNLFPDFNLELEEFKLK